MKIYGHQFGDDYGLAIQLQNDNELTFDIKKDLTRKYQQKNDIAVVIYQGGPEFSNLWVKKFKKWSLDLFNLNNLGTSPQADFYLGVSSTWQGVCFDEIFKKAKQISKVSNCSTLAMLKKPNPNDTAFVNQFWNNNPQESGDKILDTQNLFFEQLAKDLKKIGYKKIYYIAHSWSGGLVNSWIHQKGDDVFANIDGIFTVATKLIDGFKGKEFIKDFAIPFYLYNPKTDKYDVLHKQSLNQSAIVIDTYISSFFSLSRRYDNFWKKLSPANRQKYFTIYTDYDFRMGSFNEVEEDIQKEGINLLKVTTEDLIKYQEEYLKETKEKFTIKYMEKFRWKDTSFHNLLFNYFVNNFEEFYLDTKANTLTPKKNTFWDLIKKMEKK